jgi:arylsulfatase
MDYLGGKAEDPRKEFFYWTDDGNLAGVRYDRWKLLFLEQRAVGFKVWSEPLVPLRVPLVLDLRADPFERAPDAEGYGTYMLNHAFLLVAAQAYVAQHLQTYVAYPPRQKPGSFSLDQVLQKLQEGNAGKQ